MEDEAWQSVDGSGNQQGETRDLHQRVTGFSAGVTGAAAGYAKPEGDHRHVPPTDPTAVTE